MQTLSEPAHRARAHREPPPLRVLFFVEGFTDIRFVTGLSEICTLTLVVPERAYRESGLDARIAASGARLMVDTIPGGRMAFQWRSLVYLLRRVRDFDVVLSLEMLRGSFSACLAGAVRRVPVVTYMGIDPVAYFRCRRMRGQIGLGTAILGEAVIRMLMTVTGRLAARSLVVGPDLRRVAAQYSARVGVGLMYGIDMELFRPASDAERLALRERLGLPPDRFIVLNASRVSHEKDPETVLRAVALLRARGVDAMVLNLGGNHAAFGELAERIGLSDVPAWVMGKPAAHPMGALASYYRAVDVTAQGSLEEGCGYTPLESLACGTPAVATAVGGLARNLPGLARLVPKRDHEAMARELGWIAAHPDDARAEARAARESVLRDWSRVKAFAELRAELEDVVRAAHAARETR